MEKLVSESVKEFQENKGLTEGIFSQAFGSIQKLFKKVGKFFFYMIGDKQAAGAIAPVNIGIMDKGNMINSAISYVPNSEDLALDPGLSSLTSERLLKKRGPDDPKTFNESFHELRHAELLLEAVIPLEHPDKKTATDVDKKELFRDIRIHMKNPLTRPLMIWGAPGIGKTQIVKAVLAAKGEGKIIDVPTSKMAPDDWALPAIYKSEAGTSIIFPSPLAARTAFTI